MRFVDADSVAWCKFSPSFAPFFRSCSLSPQSHRAGREALALFWCYLLESIDVSCTVMFVVVYFWFVLNAESKHVLFWEILCSIDKCRGRLLGSDGKMALGRRSSAHAPRSSWWLMHFMELPSDIFIADVVKHTQKYRLKMILRLEWNLKPRKWCVVVMMMMSHEWIARKGSAILEYTSKRRWS